MDAEGVNPDPGLANLLFVLKNHESVVEVPADLKLLSVDQNIDWIRFHVSPDIGQGHIIAACSVEGFVLDVEANGGPGVSDGAVHRLRLAQAN
jgi:hypothetical protein